MTCCKILEDVRVLDFGSYLAGPSAGQFLAFLGAEVIKVEHPKRIDGSRYFMTAVGYDPPDPRTAGSQTYDLANMEKLNLSLDVAAPEGKQVMRSLVEKSDVIMENMAPGKMAKLGFGYEDARAIKPDIIYLSSSACGQFGPDSRYIGYAANFACKAGLGHLTGYEGSRPSTFVGSVDIRSSDNSVIALLAALFHRKRTGEGQYIDIASQEAIAAQLGDVFLDYAVNGVVQGRTANRRQGYAPQGAYPTVGEDSWVAVSVSSDDEWRGLCGAMGREDLLDDPRFDSYARRFENHEALDEIIADWTRPQDKYAVVEALQARRVPSGPVLNSQGLYENPHLRARGAFQLIPHRDLGVECAASPPWRFEKTPVRVTRCGAYLGEHTVQVLKGVLGMADADIEALAEKGVVHRLLD